MSKLGCSDSLSETHPQPGSAGNGSAAQGEHGTCTVPGPPRPLLGRRNAEDRLQKRRENNRQSQARYRNRQVGELQQAFNALDACKAARKDARGRRLQLLASNHTLNARVLRADENLLAVLRGDEFTATGPAVRAAPSTPSGTFDPTIGGRASTPAATHGRRGATARTSSAETASATPATPPSWPAGAGESVGDAGDMESDDQRAVLPAEAAAARVTVPVALTVTDMLPPRPHSDCEPGSEPPAEGTTASDVSATLCNMATGDFRMHAYPDAAAEIAKARQMTAQLQGARRGTAAALGVHADVVQWVLQSPHVTTGGERLSFTSATATTPCIASLYACHFTSLLEKAMLAAVLEFDEGGPGGGDEQDDIGCTARWRSVLGGGEGDPASVLAALDNALAGDTNLDGSQLRMTCGVADSVPVASAVPHAVSAVLRQYRAHLPRPVWLRACDLYVNFMTSLTLRKPLSKTLCLHGEVRADGSRVHNVNACPRCCVFSFMFCTLRDEIKTAAEGKPWRVTPMPSAALRARCAEIYSFCNLLVCQCMTDQPVTFRRMLCAARAINIHRLSAEHEVILDLFQKMRMPLAQKRAAAAMWRAWRDARTALDEELTTALLPLAGLLGRPDIVLGRQPRPPGHSVRSIDSSGLLCGDHDMPAAQDAEEPRIVSSDVCICEFCAANMAGRLLGASAHSTARARHAAQQLAEVHQRDAEGAVELLRAMCMPGVLFTAEQFARQSALTLRQGAMVDWVWLCKTASEELERDALYMDLCRTCPVL